MKGLADLLVLNDGQPVTSHLDWEKRRQELAKPLLEVEYGQLPPVPGYTRKELLYEQQLKQLRGAKKFHYRIVTGPEGPFWFYLEVYQPPGDGPFPLILTGDGCWDYLTNEIILHALGRGFGVARFNRVTIAADRKDERHGLYEVYPDGDFGALAAWAWGYHRCVDILQQVAWVHPSQIGVVGHSRGGKAALLAGAFDQRIALTAPNNSGCGGAGCFRYSGEGSETIADILKNFPYWFHPEFAAWKGRDAEIPFDQHFLKALVAPRLLLSTEALGDLWANPSGTWITHAATKKVYSFLGAEPHIGIHFREGGHAHRLEDWQVLLAFAEWKLHGTEPSLSFSSNPFENEQQ